ncbi:hypothetical protein BC937DRAFT_93512 [Endogone sp. FLAS-F59071]|nr:hypothetical protein BC937DRAFT_93512 [Endogone sp. FLAS-F59071]|eukprot:RUS14646.1 hypothetical protein BC937DRAFT_93512 [Endogone sp. FLAS-F59071]
MGSKRQSLGEPAAAPGGIGEERDQFHAGEEASTLQVQDEVRSTTIDFPTELLEEIFRIYIDGDFKIYADNPLLACSQVSRHWRFVALPLLWSNFSPNTHSVRTLRALASFLTASRLNSDGNVYDYASFVSTVYLGPWQVYWSFSDVPEAVTHTVEILRLFSSNQLRKVVISPYASSGYWINIIQIVGPIFTTLASKIASITYFEIKGVREEIINLVQHLPFSLETLILENHGTLTALFDRIHTLPNIRQIAITNAILTIPFPEALQLWGSNLSSICLLNCRGINDQILNTLATSCLNLTRLELRLNTFGASTINDEAMQRLVDACTSLEHLSCTDSLRISDEFLKYCAAHKRRLRTIKLVRCKVTGKGVRDVSGWARMELIIITDLSRATADELWWVLLRGCRALLLAQLGNTIYPQGYPPSLTFEEIARDIYKYNYSI